MILFGKHAILRLTFLHLLSEILKTACPMNKTIFKFKNSDELLTSNAGLALTGILTHLVRQVSRLCSAMGPRLDTGGWLILK